MVCFSCIPRPLFLGRQPYKENKYNCYGELIEGVPEPIHREPIDEIIVSEVDIEDDYTA